MQHRIVVLASGVGAAALFAFALALAPTMIDAQQAGGPSAEAPHSWVADAFPTGQAGFARAEGRRP